MNSSPRFEPVEPLEMADGTRIHESTHTAMSMNCEPQGELRVVVKRVRLVMEADAGTLVVRFNGGSARVLKPRP